MGGEGIGKDSKSRLHLCGLLALLMQTITFYSYKGGTGRSLALANAARYLARLEFSVVALDFDLEAPGLHYKFSSDPDQHPVSIEVGVLDYLHEFIVKGNRPKAISGFAVDIPVPAIDKPLLHLIPAGPSEFGEYWSMLCALDWHSMFYSEDAKGVEMFLDLKNRISDEMNPDFLLIDSRTGITEMGGVATTLLADQVVCLVLPTRENLEGTRAVLRSIKRSRRESGANPVETLVALSRIPEWESTELEYGWIDLIRSTLNEEAEDIRDTLACSEVLVLHSEAGLEIKETLRVGSGVSPEESVLLRDYLRLFAKIVPRELIEPKIDGLVQQAKDKIWQDPEGALKEVEELAESFGHPENYRALLRFYAVRNVHGITAFRRAQHLWELTRDASDPELWQVIRRSFDWSELGRDPEWAPSLEFVEAVWRDAGGRQQETGLKLAQAYRVIADPSRGADILLEMLAGGEAGEPAELVARCIEFLHDARRRKEADDLIRATKSKLSGEPIFVEAWARHALHSSDDNQLTEIVRSRSLLESIAPVVAARVFYRLGLKDDANQVANRLFAEARTRPYDHQLVRDVGQLFTVLDRLDEFEESMGEFLPASMKRTMRRRLPRGLS